MNKQKLTYLFIVLLIIVSVFVWFFFYRNSLYSKWQELLNKWDYKWVITLYEKNWTLNLDEKNKELLIWAYLNFWNYYYKEAEYSAKAIEMIKNIKNYENNYILLFYYWYALEITKDYENAINYYNKSLSLSQKNLYFSAHTTRQIWHIYALKWDFNKSKDFYEKAYKMNPNDEFLNVSMWSLYSRLKDYNSWKKYFENALKLTTNNFWKAEIYYNLSSLTFYLTWMTYTQKVNTSLDYAKKSVESNWDFALWYFALARAQTELWEYDEWQKNIDKGLELYPNSSDWYKFYGILELKRWNLDKALEYFEKSISLVSNDIWLMWYEKVWRVWEVEFYKSILYSKQKDYDNTTKSILNTIKSWNMQFISQIIFELSYDKFWVYSDLSSNIKFRKFVIWLNKILIKKS